MSKRRAAIAELAFERVATGLVQGLERGTENWPLPNPPLRDEDFPCLAPTSPHAMFESALGMLNVDRGMFDHHLNAIVDLIVPHRMNLSDDPFEIHNKWLEQRMEEVAERLLFRITTSWLAEAFDPYAPNTDRWWLSIALINGLATHPSGQPIHQGYHLVESVALAQRPGSWHTQPNAGPHQLDWNPHAVLPTHGEMMTTHEGGIIAANWLLDCLQHGEEQRKALGVEWIRLLLERPALIEPLNLMTRLKRYANDESVEVAQRVTMCLAKAVERDPPSGKDLIATLHQREEIQIQRAMADVLTRLFRRIGWDAVPYLEHMLRSNDENVLAAASATVGDLKYLDMEKWAETLRSLSEHPLPIVRRNLVPNLREYIEYDQEDKRGIIPLLWNDGDEVVQTRLRELLLRMEEVAPEHFSKHLLILNQHQSDLNSLWDVMELRHTRRVNDWQVWTQDPSQPLPHYGLPASHVSSKQAPSELPELEDALEHLDQELGFLD